MCKLCDSATGCAEMNQGFREGAHPHAIPEPIKKPRKGAFRPKRCALLPRGVRFGFSGFHAMS